MARRIAVILIGGFAGGRGGLPQEAPPVARPAAAAADVRPSAASTRPPAPPEPVREPTIVPPEPVRDDAISSASLDDLNRNSPLKPVFFELDSSELSPAGQKALDENATLLKRYPTWTVTIEGHCDERGTAEYNLALGERRAVAARAYLVVARHFRRSAAHGQLRQGIPVRPGSRRIGVRQEPARAFRHHREVSVMRQRLSDRHSRPGRSRRAPRRPRRPRTKNTSS